MNSEIKTLLNEATAHEWIDYLLEIQTSLILSGHFLGFTEKGFNDHAGKFAALQAFFKQLSNTHKSDS
ncbi:MAG TPA: hypothetical protein PKY29_06070 [Ferruginibacter sp.]|nr:hypothetical protein [Ferruginibacter sp.]HRO17697.1 hypothetical protein [Ferruginibacter sp.]HRQ20862.1 hypothetical protein [Ferruginibacter sp.]